MQFFKREQSINIINDLASEQLKYVIDVRSKAEYKHKHVARTINIPLEQLISKPEKYITKDNHYYIICQSGRRSKRAVKFLKKQGYQNVENLKGGINNYEIN